MKSSIILKTVLAAVFMTLGSFILQLLSGDIGASSAYAWELLSNLLIAIMLSIYVLNAHSTGWKLVLDTAAIYYAIGFFNILIEALIFNVTDQVVTLQAMFAGLFVSAFNAIVIVAVQGRFKGEELVAEQFNPRTTIGWIGRLSGANFSYLPFYLVAGALLQEFTPGFQEYYGDKLPSPLVFFMTNLFFRGFVFAGIAVYIDRTVHMTKWQKAVFVGIFFSIIGGIAPLIPVNEFMPQHIRIAHGFEVGISNFLYGICCFLIVRSKPLVPVVQH